MRYSYSSISTYDKCPRKYFYQKIEPPDLPPKEVAAAPYRGLQVHKNVEDFLNGKTDELLHPADYCKDWLQGMMDDPDMELLPEFKWAVDKNWRVVDFESPDAMIRGVIDLVVVSDTLDMFDWKTGKIYASHVTQARLYAIIGLIVWGGFENVNSTMVYFDQQKNSDPYTIQRHMVGTQRTTFDWKMERIENDEIFMPKPGYTCRWCDFSRHNGGPCQF